MSDRYVRFDRKQDNANQIIAADDINSLQKVSEVTQKEFYKARDRSFIEKCLFVLEHHRVVNGMWIDVFEDVSKVDIAKTKSVVFSEPEQAIVFPDGLAEPEGWLYSNTWVNPNGSLMKKVIVMVDRTIPEYGGDMIIEVSNDGSNWFEPPLNDSEPFEIPTDGQRLKLRARFIRSDVTVSPRLEGWAVLFRDPANNIVRMPDGTPINPNPDPTDPTPINIFHNQLKGIGPDDHHPEKHSHDGTDGSGLISHTVLTDIGEDDHHAKNHRHGQDGVDAVVLDSDVVGTLGMQHLSVQVWLGRPGTTGLYREPKLGDRLVYVKTPDDETYLFYDLTNEGRLDHTLTIRAGVAAWETMVYGDYINSTGQKEIVLLGTEKNEYDATDDIVRHEIEKVTAPDQVKGVAVSDPKTGGVLEVTWAANVEHDIAGYNVYISTDGGNRWAKVNLTLITGLTQNVSGLIDGQTYWFKVTAVDTTNYESIDSAVVFGVPSMLDTIPPAKPTSLSAIGGNGTGKIELSWAAVSDADLATYALYRSPTGLPGSYLRIATINQPITTYTDTGGIVAGSQYWYYVTAIDTTGNESDPSGDVFATA